MNPDYIHSIFLSLLVPKNFVLFIGLPTAVALFCRWGYRRSCRRNERAIYALSGRYNRDLFSAFPNYTGTCYSIGFWTVVLSMISAVVSANYMLITQMTPEMAGKIALLQKSGEATQMATSIGDFNVMVLVYGGPTVIAILFAVGWMSSWLGMMGEWFVRSRFDQAMAKPDAVKNIVVVHEPYWPWLYRRYGKRARYWPFYVRFSGTRDKRSVMLTPEAVREAERGYFVDTMPKLPRGPKPVFWALFWISVFTPLQFAFFPYAFLLASRCIYIPDATLQKKKAA